MIKPRPHQQKLIPKGVSILERFSILYLAMKTRTGKTLTSFWICEEMKFKNVLFLTKRKAMTSVKKDKKHFNYNITIQSLDSAHKERNKTYDCIIIDEAHSLGSFPKISKRASQISKIKTDNYIFLSATPSPESYSQFFHQFYVCGELSPFAEFHTTEKRSFYNWAKTYVDKYQIKINGYDVTKYDRSNNLMIKNKIDKIMLTMTQEEAGFKTTIKEKIIDCVLPDNIKNVINELVKHNLYIGKEKEIVADTPAKLKQKIHQLSSGTIKIENKYLTLSNFKCKAIKEALQDKKIAVFYKFIAERMILEQNFTTTKDQDEFQNSTDPNLIYIGQFQSSREGVKLSTADAIVFYNIDFSYLSYEQAKNRLQDFNRDKIPELYFVFSDTGIERKIYDVVVKKKNYTSYWFRKDFL